MESPCGFFPANEQGGFVGDGPQLGHGLDVLGRGGVSAADDVLGVGPIDGDGGRVPVKAAVGEFINGDPARSLCRDCPPEDPHDARIRPVGP